MSRYARMSAPGIGRACAPAAFTIKIHVTATHTMTGVGFARNKRLDAEDATEFSLSVTRVSANARKTRRADIPLRLLNAQ